MAWISSERFRTINRGDNLIGAPDIVVEVLSPSNTASEMFEKRILCMDNGCREFWVVDPAKNLIEIYHPGRVTTYRLSDSIPVGDGHYPVADILAGTKLD